MNTPPPTPLAGGSPNGPEPFRLAYLCTTFPVASETFIGREIEGLRQAGAEVTVISLWHGQASHPVKPNGCYGLTSLPRMVGLDLPLVMVRQPGGLAEMWSAVGRADIPNALNWGENLWGWAAAVRLYRTWRGPWPALWHGAWATMPAAAASLLSQLTGRPFSFGAHAYDLYAEGGDGLLDWKAARAVLLHTTTEAARRELERRGCGTGRIVLCRRGLADPAAHAWRPDRPAHRPIRLLSVGRLVPKKGYHRLLWLARGWERMGLDFEIRIVGEGPERIPLQLAAKRLLHNPRRIQWCGALAGAAIAELHGWADFFIFTGCVAPDGDRDGLPNVIPEAMAVGLPVLAAPSPGVAEAVQHGVTGFLLNPEAPGEWARVMDWLSSHPDDRLRLVEAARRWVVEHFDAKRNSAILLEAMRRAAGKAG